MSSSINEWPSGPVVHLRYLRVYLTHRFFVFKYGRMLGVPTWRLLAHDSSKLSRVEWTAYARRYSHYRKAPVGKANDPDEFHLAWTHHWHRNSHHWEHWITFGEGNEPRALEMPEVAIREMVADWIAASRAYRGDAALAEEWYANNRDRINLAPATRERVEATLCEAVSRLSRR